MLTQLIIDFAYNFLYSVQDFVIQAGSQGSLWSTIVFLFIHGGWVVFLIVLLRGLFWIYVDYIQNKYAAGVKWSLLAVDVPQENLQSVKAVEQIFAAMWPLYESFNLKDKYITGKFQLAYSLEIVSIGGYTQFLIRTPSTHRDLVEAAVYAQYPKAEIFEVEDYAQRYKNLKFPHDKLDLWGSEFGLVKPSPYPIRTYPEFEHNLTQTFADPLAGLLEVFNKIDKQEELWMQLVITPINDSWKEEAYKIINKIIGAEQPAKKDLAHMFLSPFYHFATLIQDLFIYGIGYEPGKVESSAAQDRQPINKMMYLTPEEKRVLEAITNKISKIGYRVKMRMIYLGLKGKLNKAKGPGAFIGALQQFGALNLNGFKPIGKTKTSADYFFVERRVQAKQNRILHQYLSRSQSAGGGQGFVLNIEELATLFHFPAPEIMRENVKRVEAKKEAPPVDLPDSAYEEEKVLRGVGMAGDLAEQFKLGEETPDTDFARLVEPAEEELENSKSDVSSTSGRGEPPANLPV